MNRELGRPPREQQKHCLRGRSMSLRALMSFSSAENRFACSSSAQALSCSIFIRSSSISARAARSPGIAAALSCRRSLI
jgi:hypothetical protein